MTALILTSLPNNIFFFFLVWKLEKKRWILLLKEREREKQKEESMVKSNTLGLWSGEAGIGRFYKDGISYRAKKGRDLRRSMDETSRGGERAVAPKG